ncbi:MAG: glycosyltransferase family 2 protein [Deferribacterota bacterium]|nr:glycosyltransferase family 2 protein [Deferribacterota bacterium]
MMKKISIVIPAYNEEKNISPLIEELEKVLKNIGDNYEVIFVDDGSTDNTLKVIKEVSQRNNKIKYISFSSNKGQSAALAAGFIYAQGEIIVTMDSDLQNNPWDMIKMLEYYGEYDMVIGWRHKRADDLWKRFGSKVGNITRNLLLGENINDTGCSLKIMKAEIIKRIKMFNGLHRFLPTLMRLEGAKIKEIKVDHRPRRSGKSKYGNISRAISGLADIFVVRWMIKRYIKIDANVKI